MSSGHHHQEAPAVSLATMGKLLANPAIQDKLYRAREINNEHDIPYIAGYSKNGNILYFDRHLPEILTLELDGHKREIQPRDFLRLHETLEKAIIDALGWGYFPAHAAATAYERRGVFQRVGPEWWMPYQHSMDGYAKADEHEKIKSVPKDLDMTPYRGDHRLVTAMRKAMKNGK